MRTIFDSYYIELLSHDKLYTCPDFSSFTYLWFEKFEVDQLTKKVKKSDQSPAEIKKRRAFFTIKLTSPIFHKLWDSYVFIEALNNRYTRDELMYFLNLRHQILMGPQLLTRGVSFEIYTKQKMNHMMNTMRGIVNREDSIVMQLMKKIEQFSALNEIEFVDVYQVLRIALEEYRFLKASKFITVFDILKNLVKRAESEDAPIQFSLVCDVVCSIYSDVTMSEVSQVYRLAVNLGRGSVRKEALFVAGNEFCIWTCTERYATFNKHTYSRNLIQGSLLSRLEKKFNEGTHNIDDGIIPKKEKGLIKVYEKSEHQICEDEVEKCINEQINTEEEDAIQKSLGSLGCVGLLERYNSAVKILKTPNPKGRECVGNLVVYLSRWKNMQRSILSLQNFRLMSQFSSLEQEHQFTLSTILHKESHACELQRMMQQKEELIESERLKSIRKLQKVVPKFINKYYQMAIHLLQSK